MATPEVTSSPQKCVPSAATGVSVTPSGTAWNNSSWVEVTSGLGSAITLVGMVINCPSDAHWKIDIGTGAASSETVVATLCGKGASDSRDTVAPCVVRFENIAASTRIAVRLRKDNTNTSAWTVKLLYFDSVAASLGVTANPIEASPTQTASANTGGSANTFGSWVELNASVTDAVLLGLSLVCGTTILQMELEIGAGSAGNEVAVTAMAWSINGNGHNFFPFAIPVKVPGTQRLSFRVRYTGVPVIAVIVQLQHVSASSFGTADPQYTEQPQKVIENAANHPSVTLSTTPWANSAYVEVTSGLGAAIVVTDAVLDGGGNVEYEHDLSKGSGGAESVVSTTAVNFDGGGGVRLSAEHLIPIDNIAASTRIAQRARQSGTGATTRGLGIAYYEKPL